MSGAYLGQSHQSIVATLILLRWFKAFIASDKSKANDPIAGWGHYLRREDAPRKLRWLVNVAVNRKAGIPDYRGRRDDPEYQRQLYQDQQDLRAMHRRVRIYYLRTPEVRARFAHSLSKREEDF